MFHGGHGFASEIWVTAKAHATTMAKMNILTVEVDVLRLFHLDMLARLSYGRSADFSP